MATGVLEEQTLPRDRAIYLRVVSCQLSCATSMIWPMVCTIWMGSKKSFVLLPRCSEHLLLDTKNQDDDNKHRFAQKNTPVWARRKKKSCGEGRCALTYAFAISQSPNSRLQIVEHVMGTTKDALDIIEIIDIVGSRRLQVVWQVLDQTHEKLIDDKFDEDCEKLDSV